MLETINTYPIIAHFDLPGGRGIRDGRVVLLDRGRTHSYEPYVVACQYRGTTVGDDGPWEDSWDNGDYCANLPIAFCAFVDRIRHHRPQVDGGG